MPRREQPQQPARLTVILPPDLTARVRRYHVESGLAGTVQDSVRELLLAALDYPEVESSLLRSARQRGCLIVQRDFRELAAAALVQFEGEWQRRMREGGREGAGDGGAGSDESVTG